MGYNIRVDHSKFQPTARAITDYTRKMRTNMTKADTSVDRMLTKWSGKDATSFKVKWNGVNANDSAYMHTKKSLENFAEYLKAAGTKYRDTQARAINRARSLPRW